MLIEKGDEFIISDCSQMEMIKLFLRQNRNRLRLEELYSLYVYLQMLGLEYFSLPLHILKREHPDFVLKLKNQHIGIEVVKSAPQSEEQAFAIMDKEYPQGSMLEIPFYTIGSKNKLEDGIRRPNEPLEHSGFADHGREKAWSCSIQKISNEKTNKLNREYFDKYTSNQLIIYDDTRYWPKVDDAITLLRKDYNSSAMFNFNSVHIIMNEQHLFIFDAFGQCQLFNIPSDII